MKKPRPGSNKVATETGLFSFAEMGSAGYDPNSPYPPKDFQEFTVEGIEVDRCCPRCNYQWSSGGESMDALLEN